MQSALLAFACGSLFMLILSGLYIFRIERMNQYLLAATRRRAYDQGYTEGYKDRAMISAQAQA